MKYYNTKATKYYYTPLSLTVYDTIRSKSLASCIHVNLFFSHPFVPCCVIKEWTWTSVGMIQGKSQPSFNLVQPCFLSVYRNDLGKMESLPPARAL